jgi:hypothetical protein
MCLCVFSFTHVLIYSSTLQALGLSVRYILYTAGTSVSSEFSGKSLQKKTGKEMRVISGEEDRRVAGVAGQRQTCWKTYLAPAYSPALSNFARQLMVVASIGMALSTVRENVSSLVAVFPAAICPKFTSESNITTLPEASNISSCRL